MSVLREMFPQHVVSLAAMFHGLHFRLFSPPVITFYGGISKAEFSFLSLKPQWK